jgi:hypothetical protein
MRARSQGFLSDGCIDGEPAEPDGLYAQVQPFVDPDEEAGCEAFVAAVAQVGEAQREGTPGTGPCGEEEGEDECEGAGEGMLASDEGSAPAARAAHAGAEQQQPPAQPRTTAGRQTAEAAARHKSTLSAAAGAGERSESALLQGGSCL